jgi:hypothetical protein
MGTRSVACGGTFLKVMVACESFLQVVVAGIADVCRKKYLILGIYITN